MTADESITAFLSLRMRLRNLASGMLRSETEADDALQELFVRTWRNAPSPVREETHYRAFMFSSLRNICIDTLRRRSFTDGNSAPDRGHDPMRQVEDRDLIDKIGQFIDNGLPDASRKVFELYVHEQLDYAEIAARLGISVEAARTAMSRARKAIREHTRRL